MRPLLLFLLLGQLPLAVMAQSTDQNRDLKPVGPAAKPEKAVTIPRSYALVIGISKYKNLPAEAQLQYPDRDADDIYSVLISAEGGQFPAENVVKLIDEKATAANIQHALEVWLPSVTKTTTACWFISRATDLLRRARPISRLTMWTYTTSPAPRIRWTRSAGTSARRSRANGRCWLQMHVTPARLLQRPTASS